MIRLTVSGLSFTKKVNLMLPVTREGNVSQSHRLDENHLLAALPAHLLARIEPHLHPVHWSIGQVVYEAQYVESSVYFPADSIVSLLLETEQGASAEISLVGNEGLVGIEAFLGGRSSPTRAVVQSAGSAFRLETSLLQTEIHRNAEFLMLVLRYTQALMTQMGQKVVCNRHHTIEQQLCRWILLSLDRLPDNELRMTQELIANMLGVRREGVTAAAGKLQKCGAIAYSRGRIEVKDRRLLEDLSCECYAVVKAETDRLLLSEASSSVRQARPPRAGRARTGDAHRKSTG
jgi:CRP-like cAMP-binding protein